MRVVSLIASATEIVCALGFEDALVGRSHECDFPPGVTRLPRLTEPKLDVTRSSLDIDRDLKAILEKGLSVYRVDADALAAVKPDVIVTQTQCEVCAVSEKDVEAALCTWTGGRPRIVSLAPDRLADVWADIERVAVALGAPERGPAVVAALRARLDAVSAAVGGKPRPRVVCIEWIEPLMAAGNWVPELVELAGGTNLLGVAGKHSPWMTFEDLAAADPDVICVLPCGWDVARARAEMPPLVAHPGWSELRAVRTGRVALCDGNRYMNRPGPRLVDSAEIFAEIFHGADFGHRGDGWEEL